MLIVFRAKINSDIFGVFKLIPAVFWKKSLLSLFVELCVNYGLSLWLSIWVQVHAEQAKIK